MNQKSSRSMLLALIVFSFLIITLFLYRTSVSTLYFIWVTSEYGTYKHGLLLLVIGIYFFYEAWKRCGNNIGIQLNTVGVVVMGFS
ncbi:MAG: hypothetical protein OEY89_13060, partial [Gammaproteobacteria bacterium]|nr:hypothetical protein [Gammaproteobacteria bacterium]